MNPKTVGIAMLIVVALIGFGLGLILEPVLVRLQAPKSHIAIVEKITIEDTTNNFYLNPQLLVSDTVEWKAGLGLEDFNAGTKYHQTVWGWTRYGDVEVVQNIWGPADDGVSYLVEFTPLSSNNFLAKMEGDEVRIEGSWVWREVTLHMY